MERSFYNDDFEELIKQKADQYKMYPSEKVWKVINRSLHFRKKWYWSGFVLLLSGISYFAINELITPKSSVSTAKNDIVPDTEKSVKKEAKIIPFKEYKALPIVVSKLEVSTPPFTPAELSVVSNLSQVIDLSVRNQQKDQAFTRSSVPNGIFPSHTISESNNNSLHSIAPIFNQFLQSSDVIENREPDEKAVPGQQIVQDEASIADHQKINWLQEIALYELLAFKVKRTSLQFSFSPTMNYRKLIGSKNAYMRPDSKNIPIAMNIEGELNSLVNHKPALGFELGSSILYAANKNLTLKAGLQFNYSRYDIMAYSSYSAEIATIALNNEYGIDSDSITNYTRLRNFGGDAQKNLQNQYFQFSAPVGMEWRIFGNDRLQLKVAGTVQPTYLINRNSYLITTDYKNYTREPSLVRRWNVNTSAEAFIAYRTASVKWQVGPQFRYQLLSSYSNKYPIKEYLMEYGIKVGVSKTIK